MHLKTLKPDPRVFQGNRVLNEPKLISDGSMVARNVPGGDEALFRSLHARRGTGDAVRLVGGPEVFLLGLVPEDGRIEVEIGELEEDPGPHGPRAPLYLIGTGEAFGWTRAKPLRLLHALTGGWDRLYLRPGNIALCAWKAGHPVGAVMRSFTDEDQSVSASSNGDAIFSIASDGDPMRSSSRQVEAPPVRITARESTLARSIERGDAIDPRAARHLTVAMLESQRPKLPISITYQLLGHVQDAYFSAVGILGSTGPLRVQEVRAIQGHPRIPAAARFEDGPPVPWSTLRAAWPQAPKSFDAATPIAVDATTEAPVPWEQGLQWLEGDDPIEAFLAKDTLPFATLLRGHDRSWHAVHGLREGLFTYWLARYEAWLEQESAASPTKWGTSFQSPPSTSTLPDRLEGARAWPIRSVSGMTLSGTWFDTMGAAYRGSPPITSFRRARGKANGFSLRGRSPDFLAACAVGLTESEFFRSGSGRRVLRARLGDLSRPIGIYVLRDAFPVGTVLRLFQVRPDAPTKRRADEALMDPPEPYPGLVEVETVGSSTDLVWHEEGFDLPKTDLSRIVLRRPPTRREALEHMLLARGATATRMGPSVLAVPVALLAPNDPIAAYPWLTPRRYRGSYGRITDTRSGKVLMGEAHDPIAFLRACENLNRASGLSDALAPPKRSR